MAKYVFNMCKLQLDFYKSHVSAESPASPRCVCQLIFLSSTPVVLGTATGCFRPLESFQSSFWTSCPLFDCLSLSDDRSSLYIESQGYGYIMRLVWPPSSSEFSSFFCLLWVFIVWYPRGITFSSWIQFFEFSSIWHCHLNDKKELWKKTWCR